MSTGDIRIVDTGGLGAVPTYPQAGTTRWATKAGNTALNPGEPCSIDATNGIPYVVIIADAQGTNGSKLVGIVKSKDSVTASVDGVVDVYMPLPGVVYAGKAKSSTAANTDAKVLALIGKRVIFDVTSSVVTIDTAAADAATNCVLIVGGNSANNEVYFTINPQGTMMGGIL